MRPIYVKNLSLNTIEFTSIKDATISTIEIIDVFSL